MPRIAYLGQRIDFSRSSSPAQPTEPTGLVIPELRLEDPNAEPIVVVAAIPGYGETVAPLREIHLYALPTGAPLPTPDELLEGSAPHTSVDVTNLKAQDVSLELAGLPDGSWYLQSVLVAGHD